MAVDLGADGGQSGLRMAVADPVSHGVSGHPVDVSGFSWSAGGGVLSHADAVGRAWRELGSPGPVGTLACGLSGLDVDGELVSELMTRLLDELDARRVVLSGDDVNTHAGALGGGPGVVLAAGTGVICTSIDASGRRTRTDGLGYLFGDTGGGSWLGREGLRAAVSGWEGRRPETALTERAVERYGELRAFIHRVLRSATMVAEVAAFARDVLACAEEGDPVSVALCDQAADELTATAMATVSRGYPGAGPGEVPFTWTGSILTSTDLVRVRLLDLLADHCPAVSPGEPLGGGLDGAALLATTSGTAHHRCCRELTR